MRGIYKILLAAVVVLSAACATRPGLYRAQLVRLPAGAVVAGSEAVAAENQARVTAVRAAEDAYQGARQLFADADYDAAAAELVSARVALERASASRYRDECVYLDSLVTRTYEYLAADLMRQAAEQQAAGNYEEAIRLLQQSDTYAPDRREQIRRHLRTIRGQQRRAGIREQLSTIEH
jgi:tetratricopeptide (TPR) repeat protein